MTASDEEPARPPGHREITDPMMREPAGAFVHALAVPATGELLFLSGLTAQDEEGRIVGPGDVVAQASAVFEQMERLLAAAGAGFRNVVKLTVFISDMQGWRAVTDERRRRFTGTYPTATMVEVGRFVHPEALLEVEAIAHVPDSSSR